MPASEGSTFVWFGSAFVSVGAGLVSGCVAFVAVDSGFASVGGAVSALALGCLAGRSLGAATVSCAGGALSSPLPAFTGERRAVVFAGVPVFLSAASVLASAAPSFALGGAEDGEESGVADLVPAAFVPAGLARRVVAASV
jgi:hypothetical protein